MFGLRIPQLIVYAIFAAMLVAGFAAYRASVYRQGYIAGQDELQAAVEKRNRVAAEAAQEARNALDRCYDRGGEWNQSNGVCNSK